jgi:hypothetical protein
MTSTTRARDTADAVDPGAAAQDPGPVVDALNTGLADYLNQPVRDILARLGLTGQLNPAQPPPTDRPAPAGAPAGRPQSPDPSAHSSADDDESDAGGAGGGIDPSQMIKPVTDALGTLGSGQFDDADPGQMLDGVASAFEQTAGSLTDALSGVDGVWQGDTATAATAATRTAMTEGSEVAAQAHKLRTNLAAAVAVVAHARARLIEIIGEFWATIAAIGLNIIFPWGIAAAIEAAMKAVSEASEIMVETQTAMAAGASKVTADSAPVSVVKAAQSGGSGAASGSLWSPVSTLASSALQNLSGLPGQQAGHSNSPLPRSSGGSSHLPERSGRAGGGVSRVLPGGGGGGGGGAPSRPVASRSVIPPTAEPERVVEESTLSAVRANAGSSAAGGAPVAGGAPMGHHAGAGADGRHTAASYLHTADQGEQIVGRPGSVAPAVVGELPTDSAPDIDLRI